MSDLIYLDYNCFQRSFDDRRQVRIRMEALACESIFAMAEEGAVRLVWSFMHDDECSLCPFPERRLVSLALATLCRERVAPAEEIHRMALSFQRQVSLSARDAVHLACACFVGANVLLTCDDEFLNRACGAAQGLTVLNPVEYVRHKGGGQ
jgi:transcriptional regulator NrdR family protein